jgi:transcriptional regulator with XRE-family HTH domain
MSSRRSRSGGASIGKTFSRVVQVAAKHAGGDRCREVAIGGGDHAHVGGDRFRPAHPLELALLQDPQGKKRIELGLLQRELAALLGVDPGSVNAWERNCRQPVLHRLPAIAAFVGHHFENASAQVPLGLRIAAKRRRLGLSQKALAALLGIDEGTIRRWERGEIRKRERRIQRNVEGWVNSGS